MILTPEEKSILNRIAVLSEKDIQTVKAVFLGILKMVTLEIYGCLYSSQNCNEDIDNKISIILPYLCKLDISWLDKITQKEVLTNIDIKAKPLVSLIKEIENISEGVGTPSEKFLEIKVAKGFMEKLDIFDIDLK